MIIKYQAEILSLSIIHRVFGYKMKIFVVFVTYSINELVFSPTTDLLTFK